MVLEALAPVEVRLNGGVLSLGIGQRVEAPDHIARALIERARGRVRAVPNWLTAWRTVADSVHGVTLDDPRIPTILAAIQQCDTAFERDDWAAFQMASEGVRRACVVGDGRVER